MKALWTLCLTFTFFLPTQAQDDIVDTAIAAGSFNTLVAAVQAAGLEDALRGDGPLTVFAPTDDAFAKLPEGTVEALLNDIDALQNILLYHVTAGALDAGEVTTSSYLDMLSEQVALIDVTDSGAFIAGSQIVATDIETSNGIIHVIDTVMLPPDQNIVETAVGAGIFNTLVAAVQAAGLVDTLAEGGPFTVFAPTDDAFAALPAGTVEALLEDTEALTNILLYHVVAGRVLSSDVVANRSLPSLQGSRLDVSTEGGVFINDSEVVAVDILAENGIVHVIDKVLLPPEKVGVTYRVEVTNLTRGQVFSPPAIVSHTQNISLFELGQPASAGIAAMAEDGDLSILAAIDSPEIFDIAAFDGPIQPGTTASATVQVDTGFPRVSVAGMLTSTNDTFFATESRVGTSFLGFKTSNSTDEMAWAYNAGSEANNEDCGFIPGAPCGSVASRDQANAEGYVYFSSGIHGIGDLDAATYDWRGPVAKITITRQ